MSDGYGSVSALSGSMLGVTAPVAVLSVPPALLASLVDSGRWRERGVTHWHCTAEEQPINVNSRPNEARFNTDRVRDVVNRSFTAAAMTPLDAFTWLTSQWLDAVNDPRRCQDPSGVLKQRLWHTDDMWLDQLRHTWEMLTTSATTPTGCGLQIGVNRSLDAFCYPMTLANCRRHG